MPNLISIHIPKTAGSSFGEILKQWYPLNFFTHYPISRVEYPRASEYYLRSSLRIIRQPSLLQPWLSQSMAFVRPRKLRNLPANSCIHGHFLRTAAYGCDAYGYTQPPHHLIAILRDPWAARLSEMRYRAEVLGQPYPTNILERIITDGLPCQLDYLPEWPTDMPVDEFVSKFALLGVAEKLQQSVDRLATILDKPTIQVPHINTTAIQPPRSPAEQLEYATAEALFKAKHTRLYDLYTYANSLI